METMLSKIADFYDEEVDAAVEALTAHARAADDGVPRRHGRRPADRDVPADLQDRRHDRLERPRRGSERGERSQDGGARELALARRRTATRRVERVLLVLMGARLALAIGEPRDRAHARCDRRRDARDAVAGLLRGGRAVLRRDARVPPVRGPDRAAARVRGDQRRHRRRAGLGAGAVLGRQRLGVHVPVRRGGALRRRAVPGRGRARVRGARARSPTACVLAGRTPRLARLRRSARSRWPCCSTSWARARLGAAGRGRRCRASSRASWCARAPRSPSARRTSRSCARCTSAPWRA